MPVRVVRVWAQAQCGVPSSCVPLSTPSFPSHVCAVFTAQLITQYTLTARSNRRCETMADEDALFAEFMGEIKSTVVAAEPQAVTGEDDNAASDTASVGDVNADNDEGAGGKDAETTKRKGEVGLTYSSTYSLCQKST